MFQICNKNNFYRNGITKMIIFFVTLPQKHGNTKSQPLSLHIKPNPLKRGALQRILEAQSENS
jgi:hypothetical protein